MAETDIAEDQPKLKRVMGPGLLLLFVVGDILGTGVYALTGQVAGEVGGAAWLTFVVMCSGITSASTASQAFASNLIKGFGLDWSKLGIAAVALIFMASLAAI